MQNSPAMAVARHVDLREYPGAEAYLPANPTLSTLRAAVATCHGCPLYRHATHAVLGEGPATARAVFVGEIPGSRASAREAFFADIRLVGERLRSA